jgi:hypothetical protein
MGYNIIEDGDTYKKLIIDQIGLIDRVDLIIFGVNKPVFKNQPAFFDVDEFDEKNIIHTIQTTLNQDRVKADRIVLLGSSIEYNLIGTLIRIEIQGIIYYVAEMEKYLLNIGKNRSFTFNTDFSLLRK